jgi:hypothetical protein
MQAMYYFVTCHNILNSYYFMLSSEVIMYLQQDKGLSVIANWMKSWRKLSR